MVWVTPTPIFNRQKKVCKNSKIYWPVVGTVITCNFLFILHYQTLHTIMSLQILQNFRLIANSFGTDYENDCHPYHMLHRKTKSFLLKSVQYIFSNLQAKPAGHQLMALFHCMVLTNLAWLYSTLFDFPYGLRCGYCLYQYYYWRYCQ